MNQEQLKRAVAQAAVDYILPKLNSDTIVGIGTGSTANFFIDILAEHKTKFAGGVSSSEASSNRLKEHGIPVFDLNSVETLGLYIDGADETNAQLQLVKGGGAALTREKIVASAAQEFVCIADESKWVDTLGNFPLPIEIIPLARTQIAKTLTKLGGKPVLREGVMTDNGNQILDVHNLSIQNPTALESELNQIPGVVTNGLFALRPADILLLGTKAGVKTLLPKEK